MHGSTTGESSAHAGFDHELRIDWLTSDQLGDRLPGSLGMTFLPGKQGASTRYPGRVYARDLDTDFGQLRTAGVRRLILLVEDSELARWSDPRIVERGAAAGVEVVRFPMPDGHPPASIGQMRSILDVIRGGRAEGNVAVACMGGVGRTGTVAACALVDGGMAPRAAIGTVRQVRHPTAVETVPQERFVEAFAAERQA